MLESFHKKTVTVRTKSGENLSHDSMPCQIPDDLLKFHPHRKTVNRTPAGQRHLRHAMNLPGVTPGRIHRVRGVQQEMIYPMTDGGQFIDQPNRMTIPQIGKCISLVVF